MSRRVNILFLGGAKRVSIGRMFIDAGRRLGLEVYLFSYELESHVPVSVIAEIIIGLRWRDPNLLKHLHDTVTAHSIDIIIPFVDGAIEPASLYCSTYGDAWTPSGDAETMKTLFDKAASATLFERNSLPIPATFDGNRTFPLIAKPRFGSASRGIRIISSDKEFDEIAENITDYLIQEYIAQREEYTVDCYIDAHGTPICIVPRKRLEVVGGEVSRTVTLRDDRIMELSRKVIDRLHLRGAVTLQFLRDSSTDRLLLMEINPRLGGGAVCSVHAGADLPSFILSEWAGMSLTPCDNWRDGTEISRYQQEVVFYNNPNDK